MGWVVAHDALLIGPWGYCDLLHRPWQAVLPSSHFPNDASRASPRSTFSTSLKSWPGQISPKRS